ncbi:MAG: hypothetical protein HYZ45_00435 [Burkholderiales bacterium]|nr:hypothetical protein [Burkholderiales bacterium]
MKKLSSTIRDLCLTLSIVLSAVLACVAVAHAEESNRLQEEISKKRIAPAKVAPVNVDGIRYEVIPFGKDRGFEQDSGIIRSVKISTGEELWTLKIFDVHKDVDVEEDKQEDYIVKLKIVKGKMHIKTERGKYFELDLKSKEIKPVKK